VASRPIDTYVEIVSNSSREFFLGVFLVDDAAPSGVFVHVRIYMKQRWPLSLRSPALNVFVAALDVPAEPERYYGGIIFIDSPSILTSGWIRVSSNARFPRELDGQFGRG